MKESSRTEDSTVMTRTCKTCHESKTIRGVWYALPSRPGEAPRFVCESCFGNVAAIPA